jgi:hypothetical protein
MAAAAVGLLLCIGGPCPGELSTRNDPREAKKIQTPPWISAFSLARSPSLLRLPPDDDSNFRIRIDRLWISENYVFICTCPSSPSRPPTARGMLM